MNKYETKNLIRVNKTVARKLYNLGFDVGLCPCKVNPESPWGVIIMVNKNRYDYTFDKMVDKFSWYNCNRELGQYVAYYINK